MLDKIRAQAKDELPPDYQPNLGKGFDRAVCRVSCGSITTMVERVKQGGSDEEILHWCFSNGPATIRGRDLRLE